MFLFLTVQIHQISNSIDNFLLQFSFTQVLLLILTTHTVVSGYVKRTRQVFTLFQSSHHNHNDKITTIRSYLPHHKSPCRPTTDFPGETEPRTPNKFREHELNATGQKLRKLRSAPPVGLNGKSTFDRALTQSE